MAQTTGSGSAMWHVAWTRPSEEFATVARLKDAGFDALCPAHREVKIVGGARRHWRGRERKEVVTLPAFPRYVLLSPVWAVWQAAERVDGVTTVLRRLGSPEDPGVIPLRVMDMLRGPQGDGILKDVDLTVERIRQFVLGSEVQILEGPFAGHIGSVVGQHGRRLRILLSVFGGQVETKVDERQVDVA